MPLSGDYTVRAQPRRRCSDDKEEPLFLRKTFEMISSCDESLASWTSSGETFVVKDPGMFAETVIPRYFKHSKFSSFVRQLNFYGFRKVRSNNVADEEHTKWWEFKHDLFHRDKDHLLAEMKRANHYSATAEKQEVEVLRSEVSRLRSHINTMGDKIGQLTSLVESLAIDKQPADSGSLNHCASTGSGIARMVGVASINPTASVVVPVPCAPPASPPLASKKRKLGAVCGLASVVKQELRAGQTDTTDAVLWTLGDGIVKQEVHEGGLLEPSQPLQHCESSSLSPSLTPPRRSCSGDRVLDLTSEDELLEGFADQFLALESSPEASDSRTCSCGSGRMDDGGGSAGGIVNGDSHEEGRRLAVDQDEIMACGNVDVGFCDVRATRAAVGTSERRTSRSCDAAEESADPSSASAAVSAAVPPCPEEVPMTAASCPPSGNTKLAEGLSALMKHPEFLAALAGEGSAAPATPSKHAHDSGIVDVGEPRNDSESRTAAAATESGGPRDAHCRSRSSSGSSTAGSGCYIGLAQACGGFVDHLPRSEEACA